MLQNKPALFRIPGFDPDIMQSALLSFADTDTHQYCTSGGAHGSQGVQLRHVFNINDRKNYQRIEDGIYPEKVAPALLATNILQQACPPNCAFLKTWLQTRAYVDTHFRRDDYDPETREFIIVTGDVSAVVGSKKCYGVHVDNNGMRVGCHFDAYAAIGSLASGSKIFRTCSPSTLSPKPKLNAHPHERHDIDAAFCESGKWYTIHLKSGYFMYLPMHWWHQVPLTPPVRPVFVVVCGP